MAIAQIVCILTVLASVSSFSIPVHSSLAVRPSRLTGVFDGAQAIRAPSRRSYLVMSSSSFWSGKHWSRKKERFRA
eukprot:346672-Rhodomonas_salina.1